jgi:hypothetical protein
MKAVAATGLSVVVFAAVAPAAESQLAGGLRGVTTRSPTSPVCRSDEPCSAPAKNVVLLFTQSGRVVARARTDDAGRYRVRLDAGAYVVRLTTRPGPGSGLTPRQVHVPRGRFAHVDFTIDTGIR